MKRKHQIPLVVVLLTVLLFLGISCFVAYSTRTLMEKEVRNTIDNVVATAVGKIDTLMTGVESAVDNSRWIVTERLKNPDSLVRVSYELVTNNAFIVGSTVAFVPNYYPSKGVRFAPYCYKSPEGAIRVSNLDYDFHQPIERNEWFHLPRTRRASTWSEPYFDDGGGNIMMSTYSVPIFAPVGGAKDEVIAILTADVSLEGLTKFVSEIRPYPGSYALLNSARGAVLVGPPKDVPADANTLAVRGKSKNGWTVELACPLDYILKDAHHLLGRVILFSVVGLTLIFLVSWYFSSRLQAATAAKERIESELNIANAIQTGMVTLDFPAWAHALMRPAREVGGDRYDFLESEDKVRFAIGDASGKGVPAALYTSLIGAGFRMAADLSLAPAELVSRLNDLVAEHNENAMFVTYFMGELDRRTGTFAYCNAGHNPPVILAPDGSANFLAVRRNLVLGALADYAYKGESAALEKGTKILLYTDGITEAMNAANELYGEARLMAFARAHAREDASALTSALMADVAAFVGEAPQADDITLLVVEV